MAFQFHIIKPLFSSVSTGRRRVETLGPNLWHRAALGALVVYDYVYDKL